MIQIIKSVINNYRKEVTRRDRISVSLKKHYAVKRAETGMHRVYVSEMGKRVGYYLLPNLY